MNNVFVFTISSRLKRTFETEISTFKALIYAGSTSFFPTAKFKTETLVEEKCFLKILIEFHDFMESFTALDDLAISARLKRKVNQEFVLS
jgi:hypothetical protein